MKRIGTLVILSLICTALPQFAQAASAPCTVAAGTYFTYQGSETVFVMATDTVRRSFLSDRAQATWITPAHHVLTLPERCYDEHTPGLALGYKPGSYVIEQDGQTRAIMRTNQLAQIDSPEITASLYSDVTAHTQTLGPIESLFYTRTPELLVPDFSNMALLTQSVREPETITVPHIHQKAAAIADAKQTLAQALNRSFCGTSNTRGVLRILDQNTEEMFSVEFDSTSASNSRCEQQTRKISARAYIGEGEDTQTLAFSAIESANGAQFLRFEELPEQGVLISKEHIGTWLRTDTSTINLFSESEENFFQIGYQELLGKNRAYHVLDRAEDGTIEIALDPTRVTHQVARMFGGEDLLESDTIGYRNATVTLDKTYDMIASMDVLMTNRVTPEERMLLNVTSSYDPEQVFISSPIRYRTMDEVLTGFGQPTLQQNTGLVMNDVAPTVTFSAQ
jgi:hypothetical protein